MRPDLALYRAAQGLARASAPFVRPRSKVGRAIRGRSVAPNRLGAWALDGRDVACPLAWFHAPSVGEGLQARAVLEVLRERIDGLQSAYTWFSPSAEPWAPRMPADVTAYLPWDMRAPVERTLDALAPSALVFTKTEVWPVLARQSRRRGVPVSLVAATIHPAAGRLTWPGRTFLRSTWEAMDLVAAISDDDAERFAYLGVPADVLRVTGDPGIDSAARRAAAAPEAAAHLAPFLDDPRPTLVAGSTWASDEAVVLPAADAVRRLHPELRVIVAPHEPGEEEVRDLVEDFERRGWRTGTLADVEADGAEGVDAVVVDRVGVLAELYTVGTVAYVGGGFRSAGLHSVLEPAAARLPVTFGPGNQNARAAGDLVEVGAATVVDHEHDLSWAVQEWLRDPAARHSAGEAAVGYISRHLGAAERTVELLEPHFTGLDARTG